MPGNLAHRARRPILEEMSSFVIRSCCAISLLALGACHPESTVAPKHPNAEARNGVTEKKTRKQRPPVVAPPPAYGNKIVFDDDLPPELASALPNDGARL
jgi:hypothetical protein